MVMLASILWIARPDHAPLRSPSTGAGAPVPMTTEGPGRTPARVQLFVYGSLKSGYENAHLMARAVRLGTARTTPGYQLIRYQDGYPALVHVPRSEGTVAGELYEVDAAHLLELDAFEDCPALYQRVPIELGDGRVAEAYVVPSGSDASWPTLERY